MATSVGLCSLLASLHLETRGSMVSKQCALMPLSVEQRGSQGAAGKLSMDGVGGWFGSRNVSLHEMTLGVCVLQSPFPHQRLGAPSAFTLSTSHWVLVGVSLLLG